MAHGSRKIIDKREAVHRWDGKGQPFLQDMKMFVDKCEEVGMPYNTRIEIIDGQFHAKQETEVEPVLSPVSNQYMEVGERGMNSRRDHGAVPVRDEPQA